VPEPSASFSYLERLIAGAMEAGHDDRLRDLERSLNAPDLTSTERDDLRTRIWASIAKLAALGNLDVHEHIDLCDGGDRDACLELDRRGIEPPMLELGPPPVIAHAA
jgi:hypothetical protein